MVTSKRAVKNCLLANKKWQWCISGVVITQINIIQLGPRKFNKHWHYREFWKNILMTRRKLNKFEESLRVCPLWTMMNRETRLWQRPWPIQNDMSSNLKEKVVETIFMAKIFRPFYQI